MSATRSLNLLSLLGDFPWEEAIDLIEAAQEADPDADVDELIEDAAEWLDKVVDFSKLGGAGAAIEAFDQVLFESALKLIWKTQSPEAKARRKSRREERRAKRKARKAARQQRRG
jgi:hypothetical protein